MVFPKRIFMILLMVASIQFAQSPYNSAGMGLLSDFSDASAFGLGMSGSMGGFNHSVFTQNPSTWPKLKFAKLNFHYLGGQIQNQSHNFLTGFGNLSDASFILPIKGEFAIGLGLKPFANRTFRLEDASLEEVIISGDTLELYTDLRGSGGIGMLHTEIAKVINNKWSVGIGAEFLFGVSSESAIVSGLFSGDTTVVISRSHETKGTLLSLYFTTPLFDTPINSSLHFTIRIPVGRRRIIEREEHAFIDNDGDQEHTTWDDPLPYQVSKSVISHTNYSLPLDVSLGWMYHLTGSTYLAFELAKRSFDEDGTFPTSSISSKLNSGHRLAVGLLREGLTGTRSFLNRLHYRIGFFTRQHYISSRNKEDVAEQGIALGLGIPFGVTKNQIDIGFQYVERSGFLSSKPEIINQLTIGLTLSDVWLASRKRR
ncbi:MAG: hypothetical protein ACE5EE_10280 [Fidelibacterota bacterium]